MTASSAARRHRIGLGVLFALVALIPTAPRSQYATARVEIAWDANLDTAVGYRVHIGTESGFYGQIVDVGPSTSFVYADGVPGARYYFAVSAYDAEGRESPLSDEVSSGADDVDADPTPIAQRCVASGAGDCPETRVAADALGPVHGIAALPDGRVLFVEHARQVRVLESTGLVGGSSLSVDGVSAELTELVVDPSFGRTSFVFVGITELQRDGHPDFRVIRYRLVGNTLGEGATLVSGLSFRGGHAPRFAVDDGGHIYVAMPRAADGGTDPYAGRVLRFAADGSVPPEHRGGSPIVADSVAVPLDLDWDGQAVWVVGLDERSQPAVGRLLYDAVGGDWPQRLSADGLEALQAVNVSAFDVAAPAAAAPATPDATAATPDAVVLGSMQRLYRVTARDERAAAQLEALAWAADGWCVDIAVGFHGRVHVVVRTATGSFAIIDVSMEALSAGAEHEADRALDWIERAPVER